jgi:hypothetical protein
MKKCCWHCIYLLPIKGQAVCAAGILSCSYDYEFSDRWTRSLLRAKNDCDMWIERAKSDIEELNRIMSPHNYTVYPGFKDKS